MELPVPNRADQSEGQVPTSRFNLYIICTDNIAENERDFKPIRLRIGFFIFDLANPSALISRWLARWGAFYFSMRGGCNSCRWGCGYAPQPITVLRHDLQSWMRQTARVYEIHLIMADRDEFEHCLATEEPTERSFFFCPAQPTGQGSLCFPSLTVFSKNPPRSRGVLKKKIRKIASKQKQKRH